jgi:hypothetical protein
MPDAGSMTTAAAASPSRVTPQPVLAPVTRTTIFLVLTVNPDVESLTSVPSLCGDPEPQNSRYQRHALSPEGRKRVSEAMKRRWAGHRKKASR